METLDHKTGVEFFGKQDFVGVAKVDGEVAGLYILHPNNVGRCGHHANASYAVSSRMRGKKIGESLVQDCLHRAKELGYRLLIFNAVVKGNDRAIRLYEKLGFRRLAPSPADPAEDRRISGYLCVLSYTLRACFASFSAHLSSMILSVTRKNPQAYFVSGKDF